MSSGLSCFQSNGKCMEPTFSNVYANEEQYATVSEIKDVVVYHRNEVDQNILKIFVHSMPDRIFPLTLWL